MNLTAGECLRPLFPLVSGLAWQINYNDDAVILEVLAAVPILPGDYNQNAVVDAPDYNVWRDSFGDEGEDLPADGNLNGQAWPGRHFG